MAIVSHDVVYMPTWARKVASWDQHLAESVEYGESMIGDVEVGRDLTIEFVGPCAVGVELDPGQGCFHGDSTFMVKGKGDAVADGNLDPSHDDSTWTIESLP